MKEFMIDEMSWHFKFLTNRTTGYTGVCFWNYSRDFGDNICSYSWSVVKVFLYTLLSILTGVASGYPPILFGTFFYLGYTPEASGLEGVIVFLSGAVLVFEILFLVVSLPDIIDTSCQFVIRKIPKSISNRWHKIKLRLCAPVVYR